MDFCDRGGEKDRVVHHTAIQKDGFRAHKEDDKVIYNVIPGDKGPQADTVTILRK